MAELLLLSRVEFRGTEVTGPRLRNLLALLADDLRTGCSTSRLIAGLWPGEQPENPTKALQVLVSRVRAQLGSDVVASTPTGYRLALDAEQVDATAVQVLASAAGASTRAGDHAAALVHAEAGLALWDGADGGELQAALDDPLQALRVQRVPVRRSLVRARALALSRLGRRAEAVEPLTDVAAEHPRDEEVLVELLRCEAATAGPAAALSRYEVYRRFLRDELGADPGPALQTEYQQLLTGEAPAALHGVVQEPNPLLGRDDDIAAVAQLLRTSRVTSIVGPGGLGKTRLAHTVARRAEQRLVHFVTLAGIDGSGDVVGEVASALGVGGSPRTAITGHGVPPDVLSGIVGALGPGPVLLVLDNCEHVVDVVAELVHALVSVTRDLRVLTTSRAPLGLSSESVYLLPELALPTTVQLFGQRAKAARPDVDLPGDVVTQLCRELDGLPLAVELAAARVRVMSVAEIARHLDDRFALLRGGSRDAPHRHRTLHAVVDWSWNLLDPDGQEAMRALSVFPGGFTADAAADVLRGARCLDVLEHLVDQSLLKASDTPSGTRFRMLETVREFAARCRDAEGESERVRDRFLAWARAFGVANHDAPLGSQAFSAVPRIQAEQDNLAHALRHAVAAGDVATAAAISAVLASLWLVTGRHTRLVTLSEQTSWLLSHFRPEAEREPGLAEAARTASALVAAVTVMLLGPYAGRSLVTLRRLPPAPPDTLPRAIATVLLVEPAIRGAGSPVLRELCDSPYPLLAGIANGTASYLWEREGDLEAALAAALRMHAAFDRSDTPWLLVMGHARAAEMCLQLEEGARAKHHLTEALRVMERVDPAEELGLRGGLVLANLMVGDVDEAQRWWDLVMQDGSDDPLAVGVGALAEIMLARGEIEAGLREWQRAIAMLRDSERTVDGAAALGLVPWALENYAAAVIAHVRHDRRDLVEDIVAEFPHVVAAMLTDTEVKPLYVADHFPICGAILLALGLADVELGGRIGDPAVMRWGVRSVALAERFCYPKAFQPTMSSARARAEAGAADGPAYADAVSAYADLSRGGLRAAAVALLSERDRR